MATPSKFTIRVTSGRTSSSVAVSTTGRYAGLDVNTITFSIPNAPVQTTASAKAFWQGVLAEVTAALANQ